MDSIDTRLIGFLMRDGRASFAELGARLGLSPAATGQRVRRLERQGLVKRYVAVLDPEALGVGLMAFVAVSLERPRDRAAFLKRVRSLPHVLECHHVTGDDDYVLKVRCRDTRDLEHVVSDGLKGMRGVARTRTTIVLRSEKDTTDLPLAEPPPRPGRRRRTP